jgi:proline iminopeptidase
MAWRAGGFLVAAGWGVVAGLWMPRGPESTVEALLSLAISLLAGYLTGYLTRTRWAMLLAPLLFAAAVELVRIRYRGPTVDAPHASALGFLALISGRGMHGLVTLLPLLTGAALVRRPARGGRVRRYLGRAGTGLLAAALVLVAALLVIPARTAEVPGGVAELTSVARGGHRFGLMIRGADRTAPVLLLVPGSPGGSELGAVRKHLAGLERQFVVAVLDRRGGGKSYPAIDPADTFTVADETATVLAVTEFLRSEFGRDRIYLVAHSGGTIPATLAVQQRPELFTAYVGAGQVVNPTTSDRSQYDDTVAWARTHDQALAGRLADAGPPPYDDLWSYEPMVLAEGSVYGQDNSDSLLENLSVPEHSLLDKVHVATGFLDSYDIYYPRVRDVDFAAQVPRLDVPVFFVAGAQEVPGRTRDLQRWHARLQAPHKEIVTIPDAGHRSLYQQPEAFLEIMERVLVFQI